MTQNSAASTILAFGGGPSATRQVGVATAKVTESTTADGATFQSKLDAVTTRGVNIHASFSVSYPSATGGAPISVGGGSSGDVGGNGTSSRGNAPGLDQIQQMIQQWMQALRQLQHARHAGGSGWYAHMGRGSHQGSSAAAAISQQCAPSSTTSPTASPPAVSAAASAASAASTAPHWLAYQIHDATDPSKLTGEEMDFGGRFAQGVAGAVDGAKLNDGMHRLYQFLGQVSDYQTSGHDLSPDQLHGIANEAEAIYNEAIRTPSSASDAGDYSSASRDGVFDPGSPDASTHAIAMQATMSAAVAAPAADVTQPQAA